MQFKKGADAVSRDGEKIGSLERVVIDPETREIAYLVVKSGFLLAEDKLISIKQVDQVTEDNIVVKATKEQLNELPPFEDVHYVPSENDNTEDIEQFFWYPPPAAWYAPGGYYPLVQPRYIRVSEKNIPENMVALKEGAEVLSSDGEHVGNIDQLIVDGNNEYVTHLVISSGLLLKERKMIPAYWLTNVSDDEVHLAVESRFLDRLPEFHA